MTTTGSFDYVRSWLHRCDSQHISCSKTHHEFVPKRLIRVNSDSRHSTVTLVSPDSSVKYAALSYCWGGPLRFKTNSETLSSALAGLPVEVLPQTVQDAIRVTRELGLEYIWVDSICIVQDDEVEKIEQIAEMARIFGHSYVTIAATGAARSSNGFLSSINPFRLLCKLSMTTKQGLRRPIVIGKDTLHYFSLQPLAQRAWTLQETLLSSRIVSFEYGHVHWYCSEASSGTCGMSVLGPSGRPATGIDPGFTRIRQDLSPELAFTPQECRQNPWQRFVTLYSGRALTLPSDRLRAVSAAAELCGRFGNSGRYFAGLWERDLPTQLIWSRSKYRGRQKVGGRNLYAPSWSWAASDGAVRWPPYLERCSKPKPSCEVISVEVDLVSANAPFGDVSAGILKLSGRLKKATCVWGEENRLFDNEDSEKEITGYYVSLKTDGHNEQSKTLVHCFEILSLQRLTYLAKAGCHQEYHTTVVAALVLVRIPKTEKYKRMGVLSGYTGKCLNSSAMKTIPNEAWWSEGWQPREIMIL